MALSIDEIYELFIGDSSCSDMDKWNEIKTQEDIDFLINECCGFHDSCIVNAFFKTGSYVNKDGAMAVGGQEKNELWIIIDSQSIKKSIHLHFSGVRQWMIPGWQDNYGCELSGCYLKIHRDLYLPHRDDPMIVWSDLSCFDPKGIVEILREPMYSFVIASKLEWQMFEKN